MSSRATLAALLVAAILATASLATAANQVEIQEARVTRDSDQGEIAYLVWFQGYIADPSTGEPVTAVYDIIAEIFDAEADGASLWGPETHAATEITDGWFSIKLGTYEGLSTFDAPPYFLELTVNGEVLTPRLQLASVPSAYVAQTAVEPDHDWGMNNDVVYKQTGQVGIGTAAPDARLDVVTDDFAAIKATSTVGDGTAYGLLSEAYGSGSIYGVAGWGFGSGSVYGVAGFGDGVGVHGSHNGAGTWGELGAATAGVYGSHGYDPGYWAGYFNGGVHVTDSLGVGTEYPAARLDVQGTARVSGFTMPTGAYEGYLLSCDGGGNAHWEAPGVASDDGDWGFNGSDIYSAMPGRVGVNNQYPDARLDVVAGTHETNAMKVTNTNAGDEVHGIDISVTGDVARGLYSETHSVSGEARSVHSYAFINGGTAYGMYSVAAADTGWAYGLRSSAASGSASSDRAYGVRASATTPADHSYGVFGTGGTWGVTGYHFFSDSRGQLGGALAGVYGEDGGGAADWAGYFDGSLYVRDNVGVGTEHPWWPVHVYSEAPGTIFYGIELENFGGGAGTATGLLFKTDGGAEEPRGKGGIVYERTNTWNRGSFHILQDQNGNYDIADLNDAALTVTNARNVGIGTTAPASKLEVAGMIHSTSGGFKFPDGSVQTTASPVPPMAAGNVVLDERGEARVSVPDLLRGELLYQLTCVGGYAPVYVADKVRDGEFRIAGGVPGMEVCWQVTQAQ